MSPFRAQCTWSRATWEIMESEHIDFPATDPGGSPDEELQRKFNNLILLQPGPAAPAAPSSPGWGHRAAPPGLAHCTAGLPTGTARESPFSIPVPSPSHSALSGHILRTCRGSQLPLSPRVYSKGVKPQIWVFLLPAHPH